MKRKLNNPWQRGDCIEIVHGGDEIALLVNGNLYAVCSSVEEAFRIICEKSKEIERFRVMEELAGL